MSQQQDKTILERLRGIAEALEIQAGLDPAVGLRKDRSLTAQLQRIEDAVRNAPGGGAGAGTARTISFVVQDPENIKTHAGRGNQSFAVWLNDTGFSFRVTKVVATSDADNYAFALYRSSSVDDLSTGADTLLDNFNCANDGTSSFFTSVESFAADEVPDGTWLIFEHVSGSAEVLSVLVEGNLA